jgi:hypothetical protein
MFRTASERASEHLSVHGVGGLLKRVCLSTALCLAWWEGSYGWLLYVLVSVYIRVCAMWKAVEQYIESVCISVHLHIQNSFFIGTGFLLFLGVFIGMLLLGFLAHVSIPTAPACSPVHLSHCRLTSPRRGEWGAHTLLVCLSCIFYIVSYHFRSFLLVCFLTGPCNQGGYGGS